MRHIFAHLLIALENAALGFALGVLFMFLAPAWSTLAVLAAVSAVLVARMVEEWVRER